MAINQTDCPYIPTHDSQNFFLLRSCSGHEFWGRQYFCAAPKRVPKHPPGVAPPRPQPGGARRRGRRLLHGAGVRHGAVGVRTGFSMGVKQWTLLGQVEQLLKSNEICKLPFERGVPAWTDGSSEAPKLESFVTQKNRLSVKILEPLIRCFSSAFSA